jgi:hypothetical protein
MVTKCDVHDNDMPCAECAAGVRCAVENCSNMTHQGEFRDSICSPCWQYLGHGRGTRSQAYRNSREKFIHSAVIHLFERRVLAGMEGERLSNCMKECWKDAYDLWNVNHPES